MSTDRIILSDLLEEINQRTSRAVTSVLGLKNNALAQWLSNETSNAPGSEGSFLADPVIEATFGWEESNATMSSLSGRLLESSLVEAMDNPPKELAADYRFAKNWHPYSHQLKAWETLLSENWKSTIVSSGTGSGKTECFLVPILNDLARQAKSARGPIEGVQAIFLYPLNALINSQRERLRSWTADFDGAVRYCLYNGETPKVAKSTFPEEVSCRKVLRESPPPVLVTNSTMLEYMLVRQEDHPIIDKSQGQLRWIVLDEAHSYIGSMAAELTLLLRRVMHAFNVDPKDVRFVATSATIGEDTDEDNKKLVQFLAGVSGTREENIRVIRGQRTVPEIHAPQIDGDIDLVKELPRLSEMSFEALFEGLSRSPLARRVRDILTERGATSLSDIVGALQPIAKGVDKQSVVRLLDQCSRARDTTGSHFLPFRAHIFGKTLSGIWACSNCKCEGKAEQTLDDEWGFGVLYFNNRDHCAHCKSPVFELATCTHCGTEYLAAEEVRNEDGIYQLVPASLPDDPDEFLLDDIPDDDDAEQLTSIGQRLICADAQTNVVRINPATYEIEEAGALELRLISPTADAQKKGHSLRCGSCDTAIRYPSSTLRPQRIGAPFFLNTVLPNLLALAPEEKKINDNMVFGGRRLLTFTDSRQGTAHVAARVQQLTDLNYIRSNLYHAVAAVANKQPDPLDHEKLRSEIEKFKEAAQSVPAHAVLFEAEIEKREAELANTKSTKIALSWSDANAKIQNFHDVRGRIFREFKSLTETDLTLSEFADFCLFREFARRPKRTNQAETLGLIQLSYPKIDEIIKAPDYWSSHGVDLDDWKTFLYVMVDQFIRPANAVSMPGLYPRWMGRKYNQSYLLGPDSPAPKTTREVSWPEASSTTKRERIIIVLLRHALGLTDSSDGASNRINFFLREAWTALSLYMPQEQLGRQLDLKTFASFSTTKDGWACSYTNTIFSRLLKGYSPYTPFSRGTASKCKKVTVPSLPNPFWRDELDKAIPKRERTRWVNENPNINALRRLGVWGSRSDEMVLLAPWFAIAEHSAQIPAKRLKVIESDFKAGAINILSCSTTMEMGVDIGGMSAVALNNTPPSPANYLQRVGRAGRRGESVSVGFTLCPQNAHGMQVFNDPMWPFKAKTAVPYVSLDSRSIVQRHVNSLLFSIWLNSQQERNLKLTSAWLLEQLNDEESRAAKFVSWCLSPETHYDRYVTSGLERVTRGTCLEGLSVDALMTSCAEILLHIETRWVDDLNALVEDRRLVLDESGNDELLPAVKSINRQLKRIRDEYLLSELANRGFLPGYGFPTGVVSFVNSTMRDFKRRQREDDGSRGSDQDGFSERREDSWGMNRGYPSRSLDQAIQEYSPGAEVVIGGLVYRSSGVTLNWHIPISVEDVSEVQALRWAWFCAACGAGGTSNRKVEHCQSCSSRLHEQHLNRYLQPAGFATELTFEPHNDVSAPVYMPRRDPRLSIKDEAWQAFPEPHLGQFRYSDTGTILHRNTGRNGHGFSVCLRCGRASEQNRQGERALDMAGEHRRLRGGKDKRGDVICEGSHSQYAVVDGLWLAAERTTAIYELHLRNPKTDIPLKNESEAWSIGFALREALTRLLGIHNREVSVSVQQVRMETREFSQSIFLFDTATQGAGYVEYLRENLGAILPLALKILDCPQNCDSACHACLMSWDSQHRAQHLNRHEAKAFLAAWKRGYALPVNKRYFGEKSHVEYKSVVSAITDYRTRHPASKVRLFIDVNQDEGFSLSQWSMTSSLIKWALEGTEVEILVSQADTTNLPDAIKRQLRALTSLPHPVKVSVMQQDNELGEGARIAATIEKSGVTRLWAAKDINLQPDDNWALTADALVCGQLASLPLQTQPFPSDDLDVHIDPQQGDIIEVNLRRELNGPLKEFGNKFWSVLSDTAPSWLSIVQSTNIESIAYSDRYIRSPLSVLLLSECLRSLVEWSDTKPEISIRTTEIEDPVRVPTQLHQNWDSTKQRDEVLQLFLEGISGRRVHIETLNRRELPHARVLTVRTTQGVEMTIRFDEGMGCWDIVGKLSHSFYESTLTQARQLTRINPNIRMRQPDFGTWIVLAS